MTGDRPVSSARPTPVVLASASPRRRELLERIGVVPRVVVPDVDETPHAGEGAVAYVTRLAAAKADTAAVAGPALVLAADTTVELDGELLGKPGDADHARSTLAALSGRTHRVHTGVAARLALVEGGVEEVVAVSTEVTLARLDPATVDWYVSTGEPLDKAGAYAIQGAGAALVERIDGSVTNVIGLPLAETIALARRLGVELLGT